MKKIDENMTVNDGKGFYDNEGLVDTILVDCNELLRFLAAGQYLGFCGRMVQVTQKLTNLKAGIRKDLESKDRIIEELKRANKELPGGVADGTD